VTGICASSARRLAFTFVIRTYGSHVLPVVRVAATENLSPCWGDEAGRPNRGAVADNGPKIARWCRFEVDLDLADAGDMNRHEAAERTRRGR